MMMKKPYLSTMKKAAYPEDVLTEIFQRLPIKSICKFKCLSKVWLSNLSDTNFMRNKLKTIEEPWAFYSNNHMSTRFISSCRELSVYDGLSFSFLSQSDHKLYILASNNGLVLCSAVHDHTSMESYFVCNPITKNCVSLPPPPKNSVGEFLYGLVCDTDSNSPFKVVRTRTSLKSNSNAGFEVDTYFSDLDEWRTYNVAYPQPREETTRGEESISNVTTHNGVVYWIEEHDINRVVAYDLTINNYERERHQCDVFDVPIIQRHLRRARASSECIGVSGDHVCYAHIRRNGGGIYILRIWVLGKDEYDSSEEDDDSTEEDDDSTEEDGEPMDENSTEEDYYSDEEEFVWKLRHEIDLPSTYPKEYSLMGFSPTDPDVVILTCGDHIFPYDASTEKRVLCQHERKTEFLHSLCVPFRKISRKTKHAYAVIVTPTLTTVSKARR